MENFFGLENKEEVEYELEKTKQNNVFDYVKSINNKDNYLGDNLDNYSSYIITRALASYSDCIFYVKEINLYPSLGDRLEYDFYYYGISKKKRFAEWMKRNNADVDIVSKFYNVSKKKALEFLDILTESEMKYIKNSLHYGVIEK
tara:strand:+ start:35519 stop:35953 length:435 start_codon:yes stop_codon:yes gene_type:complete